MNWKYLGAPPAGTLDSRDGYTRGDGFDNSKFDAEEFVDNRQ